MAARAPPSTFGMVLTRIAPGEKHETQSPPLLNSATLPSGLRAATLTSGGASRSPVSSAVWRAPSRNGVKAAG